MPASLPMLKPFRQAVDFQLQRVPMTRTSFDQLDEEAKRRAFTIAGLTRKDLLESAYAEATRAIASGQTKQEFLSHLGGILDKQGGTFLPSSRLQLIAENNLATAYTAGRWKQMNDPEVLARRPYRQYPLGPHDDSTSEICLELEGLTWLAGDPIEKHVLPSNHHRERHLQVTTLTEEQALATGKMYASPEGGAEYPHVNGKTVFPDPGFDSQPGLLTADDAWLTERARQVGVVIPARVASDYELPALVDVAVDDLPDMPSLMPRLTDVADAAEVDAQRARFRELFGIAEDESSTIVNDVFGDGARVGDALFEKLTAKDDRSWLAPAIKATIEDPYEAWIIAREDSKSGAAAFHKRYVGLFRSGDERKAFLVILDDTPDGLVWDVKNAFRDGDWTHLEQQRAGRLLMSKARKG
jgi:hypothetical protein